MSLTKQTKNKILSRIFKPMFTEFHKLKREKVMSYHDIALFLRDCMFDMYNLHKELTDISENSTEHTFMSDSPKITEQTKDDISELQNKIVQMAIDFINGHSDLNEAIADTKKEASEELGVEPDVEFHFSVDGLDWSLEKNTWTPASDSYIGVSVGRKNVISMY